MKKSTKILLIIIGIFIVFSMTGADCNIMNSVLGGKSGSELTKEDMQKAVANVANVMASVSGAVAIIFLIYGGILYISSAGDQNQTGKAKQAIVNSIVGLVLIACSWVIVRWFMNFVATGTIGF